jgi:hypothetical protein
MHGLGHRPGRGRGEKAKLGFETVSHARIIA